MNFNDGLDSALLDRDVPIVTDYDFFILGRKLFEAREWRGETLKRLPIGWDRTRARNALRRLEVRKAIAPDIDFRSGVWRVVQSARSGSAEEVACIVDPFCYVSHLSAMQRYGLSDRSPAALHITTPARAIWKILRDEKIVQDLGGPPNREHPPLLRLGFKGELRRRPVIIHESSHPAKAVEVRGEQTRITSIGRTFGDMLSEPALCGGIRHVIDIWKRDAKHWGHEIIGEIDKFDSKIVKVRAGYLLSEVVGIVDDRIDGWVQFAQRGGSRRLDPDAAYASTYSERWMISLNA